MAHPNSEQELRKLLEETMNRDPKLELNPAKIKFYSQIGDTLELAGELVVWLN